MLCGSAGARSCSDDLCFMDSFLAAGAQGEGVGISFPASASSQEGACMALESSQRKNG